MPEIIQDYSDNNKDQSLVSYYMLSHEIFKGLELCATAIDIDAYTQIGTLLRQLLEQIATLKLIGLNKNTLKEYNKFYDARLEYIKNKDSSTLQTLKNKSKLSNKKKGKDEVFASFGWIESCGATEISYDKLLELADLKDFVKWRKFYNHFVHGHITILNYYVQYREYVINEFIYFFGIIMDELMNSFRNITGFNFNFSKQLNRQVFEVVYIDLHTQQQANHMEIIKKFGRKY